ncbi:hypothetical protein Gorai_003925 [Gossypium raimondii]|uniref:Uncharacterized protein n=1 Tax=Gossypium raimondii TaxID=29730 RepID=A0A7J8QGQ7_GOSRA|nr:hypothetical protein [Gossypium raimondii]
MEEEIASVPLDDREEEA